MQSRFGQLAADYKKQLPQRIKAIRSAFIGLRDNLSDSVKLDHLIKLVHRIAGSGATFGFDTLSATAKKIEEMLKNPDIPLSAEMLDAIMAEFLSSVDSNFDSSRPQSDLSAEFADFRGLMEIPPDGQHIIYLVEKDLSNVSDLASQLGFFGYDVHTISEMAGLSKLIGNSGSHLVIINCSVLLEENAFSELTKLKKENNFQLIFVSEEDSFDARLLSVRAGGEAFFLLPLDISRLIDRIETMVGIEGIVPYHILIVDDDPEQISYHAFILQQAGMITSVASEPSNVMNILVETKPELILMDVYMPGCNGVELAKVIRQQEAFVNIPIVFLSSESNLDKQIEAVEQGADDFLTKPIKPKHLISAIRSRVARTRSIRYFAERDSLTGLLNHTNLKEQLHREVMRASRTNSNVCFAMIDADHFKQVNDTYGHTTGDRVLKILSRLLQERLRRTDFIGRYGGEEFGVILLNSSLEDARRIMDRIREDFAMIRHQEGMQEFYVSISCGIASFPKFKTAALVTEAADKALYEAKEAGRNQVKLA